MEGELRPRPLSELDETEKKIWYLARQMARENTARRLTTGDKDIMQTIFRRSAAKKLGDLTKEGVTYSVEIHKSAEGYMVYDKLILDDLGYFYNIAELEADMQADRGRIWKKTMEDMRHDD